MDKTLSSLNEKIWYRLIKVIYLLIMMVFIFSFLVGIFLEYKPDLSFNNSFAQCKNGIQITGKNLKNEGINYISFIDSKTDSKIKSLCIIHDVEEEFGTSDIVANFEVARLRSLVADDDTYKINYTYEKRDWTRTLCYSILSIIITLVIFELIRRAFYYIVLGKINPKK